MPAVETVFEIVNAVQEYCIEEKITPSQTFLHSRSRWLDIIEYLNRNEEYFWSYEAKNATAAYLADMSFDAFIHGIFAIPDDELLARYVEMLDELRTYHNDSQREEFKEIISEVKSELLNRMKK